MALPTASDLLVPSTRTVVDRSFFNKKFLAILAGFQDLDTRMQLYDAQVETLVATGLDRLNDTLGPMLTTIAQAQELGFLVCEAVGGSVSLTVGQPAGFVVTSGAELFSATPFLLAQDKTDYANWGILSLDEGGWTRDEGSLSTHVVYCTSTAQASTQWVISANSAMLPAIAQAVIDMAAAQAAAEAARDEVETAVETLQDLLEGAGAVISVAGKTGIVDLVLADVAGLVDALAAKATISWATTQLAGKQNASAKLQTLIDLTWAANKLIYATSPTALGTLTITDFIQTLLDDANAAAALGTLGVSSFIQTLLDDADAASARSTLGVVDQADLPVKATLVEVLAGTDDDKFVTPLGAAGTYSKKSLDRVTMSANGTLDASHNGKTIVWTKATAGTITLSATAPVDTECLIVQEGAGKINFLAEAGGSRASRAARYYSNGQYSFVSAYVHSNSAGNNAAWRLGGDLALS